MSEARTAYTRLRFDRPHHRVLRVTMDNGKMNAADDALHRELGDVWRDRSTRSKRQRRDPHRRPAGSFSAGGDFKLIEELIADFETRARVWKEARDLVYNVINCSKPIVSAMRGAAVGAGLVVRHPGRYLDRGEGLPHHRRPHAARRRRRRPRRDHLAAALRHGEGEILPAALRPGARRGGGTTSA